MNTGSPHLCSAEAIAVTHLGQVVLAAHGLGLRRAGHQALGPPPVHAFWSFTAYDAKTRLLVEHPSGRYAVRDRDAGQQRGDDGSLTLILQQDSPGRERELNWLPMPLRPFQVVARLYRPKQELLDKSYLPPGICIVE